MLSDFRLALRTLAKSPSFAAVVIFTLALGIGVNTAMFSIVDAVILRGLPFPEQHRVLHVENNNLTENINGMGVSWPDFTDYRDQQKSFVDLAAYQERTFNISGPGNDPERVTGCGISAAGPDMVGVPPHLGRWFLPAEDRPGAAAVVVIGYPLWQNRFKADPDIIGRQIRVNSEWATIVGVGPKDYRFPENSDAWMPLRFAKEEKRDNRYWEVFGRLQPGVTEAQARAELTAIAARLATDHAGTNAKVGVVVKPLRDEFIDGDTRQVLGIMLAAVFGVLLIACTNVANLLLSRAALRQKDIAVRAALGAGRGRIVRMLLTESLVLCLTGAAFGLALAYGLMAVFDRHIQANDPTPYWMVFKIDHVSMIYIGALAVVSAAVAGLWPAWHTSRSDLTTVLKDGGRGSTGFSLSRFTRVMVIFEVVLSTVLLVLAGLTIRSVIKMQTADLGFQTAGIFTNRVGLPETEYPDAAKQKEFYRQLLETLAARPEVATAALGSIQPTWNNRNQILIEELPRGPDIPKIFSSRAAVSGSYFSTLGIRLLQGRTFDERDTATGLKVAVVNTAFAEQYWPGKDPIGRKFIFGPALDAKPEDWITVIGVVAPTLQGEFNGHSVGETGAQSYLPYQQDQDSRFRTLFVKARNGQADPLAPVIRRVVRDLNQDLPVYWPQSLGKMVEQAKFFKKLFAWIYGVMSYSVSQRTQEIGVRVALGASPRDVLRLILREGGLRLLIGLAIGAIVGYFGSQLLATQLYAVQAGDPPTFIGTLLVLGTIGLLATLVPALRALRVNPVVALRNE